MKFLYLIPARKGSKGITHKNTRLLNGKPLISHTIECALEVADSADICISTNDEDVVEICKKYNIEIPFLRPEELASDTAGQYDVIKHAYNQYKINGLYYDAVILLQPTSPLRKPLNVREAKMLYSNNIDMVVSVCETKSNPYFVLYEENEHGFLIKSKKGHFIRRQDCPKVWEFNGAIYVINHMALEKYNSFNDFCKIIKYPMNEYNSVDIDNELDFMIAELIMNK
ncbi:MAG: acylneuraminate cytidylyltransferase family protein [Bacteroidales bacterium]|nr:acylneuraminate cytidylyltransferase family protein [Bacteroidales bacterium]